MIAELDVLQEESLSATEIGTQSLIICSKRSVGRAPTSVELYTARSLIDELQQKGNSREQMLTRVVHGVFASIDFRYLD